MKFVFDLDGTLSFDGVTIDDEIKQVLLRAEEFGHEVAFASARSYRDCLGLLGDPLSQQLVMRSSSGLKRQTRPISAIMRMKNASISIQQTRIKRQP